MPRVNVEEVRVRIDDCWDKDNGQYYSIDFGNRETKVPDVSKASYEDQCSTFQELIGKNRNIDYSGELQSQIIDACLEIIKEQKKMGKKAIITAAVPYISCCFFHLLNKKGRLLTLIRVSPQARYGSSVLCLPFHGWHRK